MFKHLKDLYKCLYDNPWQRDTAIIIKWMLVFMVFYSIFTGIIFTFGRGDKVMLKKICNFYKEDIYGKRTVCTLTIVFILLMIALTYMDIVAYATRLF